MKIGVLGYGNLAKALLQGITSNGNINKKDITITAKSEKTLETAINNGYNAVNSVSEVFTADLVILAVKPAVYKTLLPLIPSNFKGGIVSTMACYSLQELKNDFKSASVIRIMPSLLSSNGNDLIAVCGDTDKFTSFTSLLENAGKVIITNEEKFNAYLIAVSCGVGFSAYIVESYNKALLNLGFSSEESKDITSVIFSASAVESNREEFYKKVATKGGVTELGLNEFENGNLNKIVENGVLKAYNKVVNKG